MNILKKIPFEGIIFLLIISYAFSKVITSNEYSKSRLNVFKRDETNDGSNKNNSKNIKWFDKNNKPNYGDITWTGGYENPKVKYLNSANINDPNNVYLIAGGEPFSPPDAMPSSDQNRYTISRSKVMSNILNNKFCYQDNNKDKALRNIKRAAIDVVDKMFISNIDYNLQFIAGVIANLQSEGTVGEFENTDDYYIKEMDKKFKYNEYYEGKNIQDIGISCAYWLSQQTYYNSRDDCAMFGFGIAQWTFPDRNQPLLEKYKNYIYDSESECENDRTLNKEKTKCKAKDNRKDKNLSIAEIIEIESSYFMEEIESSKYSHIYQQWNEGEMHCKNSKCKKGTENCQCDDNGENCHCYYKGRNTSNAAMFFCMEFENPGVNNCEFRRVNAEMIYNVMVNLDNNNEC